MLKGFDDKENEGPRCLLSSQMPAGSSQAPGEPAAARAAAAAAWATQPGAAGKTPAPGPRGTISLRLRRGRRPGFPPRPETLPRLEIRTRDTQVNFVAGRTIGPALLWEKPAVLLSAVDLRTRLRLQKPTHLRLTGHTHVCASDSPLKGP